MNQGCSNLAECSCGEPPPEFPAAWDDINSIVQLCVDAVCEADEFLLTHNANERTVAHRLGVRLEAEFRAWDVDCEYNRIGNSNQSKRQPRIELLELITDQFCEAHGFSSAARRIARSQLNGKAAQSANSDRLAYPDIVVHKRGCPVHNLLVIEMKTERTPRWQTAIDLAKLHSFTLETELSSSIAGKKYPRYRSGLFLNFGMTGLKAAVLFRGGSEFALDPKTLEEAGSSGTPLPLYS